MSSLLWELKLKMSKEEFQIHGKVSIERVIDFPKAIVKYRKNITYCSQNTPLLLLQSIPSPIEYPWLLHILLYVIQVSFHPAGPKFVSSILKLRITNMWKFL